MSVLPVVDRWFERKTIDDSITLLWEPHVIPLMRCNIWHVRGRDRDLIVDTGMGFMSLGDEMADLLDKNVTAVATHGHDDHIGGHHEFDDVVVHPAEAPLLLNPPISSLVPREAWGDDAVDALEAAGLPDARALLRHRAARRHGDRLLSSRAGRSCSTHRGRRRDRSRGPLLRGDPPAGSFTGIHRTVGGQRPARCSPATRSTTVRCWMNCRNRRSPTTASPWIG